MEPAPIKVGILSPGDMGGATGAVLRQHGVWVYACLSGRGDLTRQIATEAGFTDMPSLIDLVNEVHLLLSILVPDAAIQVAEAVADAIKRTNANLVYVDCNAVAPQTVRRMEKIVSAGGAKFIDAGIIGGPAGPNSRPRFYCSGPNTAPFEVLGAKGLDVRPVGPEIGQASGLKMVYAASTKGTTALWTELLVASRALGLEEALLAEFGPENAVAERLMGAIPSMPRRARRWIGEMEEIAATFEALGLTPNILGGAADMYRFIGETELAAQSSREPDPSLDEILELLTNRLSG